MQHALDLEQPSTVWRLLCLGAALVSVTAAVAANLIKPDQLTARIPAAEAALAQLDRVETALKFRNESVAEVADQLDKIASSVPWIRRGARPGATVYWLFGATIAILLVLVSMFVIAGRSPHPPPALSPPPSTTTPAPAPGY